MSETELMQLVQAARAARRVIYRVAPSETDSKRGTLILKQLDSALKPFKDGIDPSHAASIMGSIRSERKAKSSAQNGSRPKKPKT